ncbi:probable serine hydrolase [Musca vetustissima]|uniref:probable serine hydrolase n=1 Tax=Musca vetustissima TaxID=27455 RepID=UPI002AB63B58|nr:probable serine hydrolase [Musca vetustissima]
MENKNVRKYFPVKTVEDLFALNNVIDEDNRLIYFEDIKIDVPWGQIVGRWYGNRKVRPILAIHGWMDNLGTWDRLIPLLPKHVGILCIDLPGHGRSSKLPLGITYHVFEYIFTIVRIVKEYKWRKVSLMGHSMGAIICFHYAALNPYMVDMLIQIDLIKDVYDSESRQIKQISERTEKLLIENERLEQLHIKTPPCYSYEQLEEALYRGSHRSVEKQYCKHLLNRSIAKAEQHPEKFYFSRDPRIKHHVRLSGEQKLSVELAKRIRNIPYMLVRSHEQSLMTAKDEEIVDILRANNPHFHYVRVKNTTHHLHLNSPEEVAAHLDPFILQHRPVILDSWSIDGNDNFSVNKPNISSKL